MADTSRPDHLPNLRRGSPAAAPVLAAQAAPRRHPADDRPLSRLRRARDGRPWDEATKKVVLARLEPPRPLRFFTADEEPCLRAFCDTVLAQDTEPRVPVAESVDGKLAAGKTRRLPVRRHAR